jgi:DNA repair photolyase
VSDAYQPVEQDQRIMRWCAEILVKYDIPVVILTKSSLILRDLDIWAELNRKSRFLLMMSISTTDETVRTHFEPGASSLEQRFETLRQFKQAGCSTGVLAMPLLPYITETESSMCSLALAVKNAGVDFCMPGGLTLRPGVQKETFMACIRATYPHYAQLYEQIYNQNRQSGAPSHAWHSAVQPYYKKMIETTGLSPVIPHTIFKGLVSRHEEVFLVMSLMKVACEYRSIDTKRLQKAISNYYQWVIEQRRPVNRSRKASYAQIDRALENACENGSIATVTGNEKLGAFVTSVVKDNAEFDFRTLRFK